MECSQTGPSHPAWLIKQIRLDPNSFNRVEAMCLVACFQHVNGLARDLKPKVVSACAENHLAAQC